MAHIQQKNYLEKLKSNLPEYFSGKNVLEVGSLNINGTIRDLFSNCNYIGIDVGEGKDVDLVIGGHEYDAPAHTFDVCASCECFEHNPYWKETFANMIRMCKPNGLIFITCATIGRHEHGTLKFSPHASPFTHEWNYYKNLSELDFRKEFDIEKIFKKADFEINNSSRDLYFYGIKL